MTMTLDQPKIFPISHECLIRALKNPHDPHSLLLTAAQQVVDWVMPDLFFPQNEKMPLFRHTEILDSSETFSLAYICPAEYTHRARRYVIDTLNRWLIPGKQIEIVSGIFFSFEFINHPGAEFFVAQDVVLIKTKEEAAIIRRNLPELTQQLKEKLQCEFIRQTEYSVHPIFMPRNEEEMIRNLIALTSQIKYVRDLPQVSIHYEKQTDSDLIFTVIIAKLLKTIPLRKILEKSELKMDIDDIRVMGYLKQKYPKEAAVLRLTVNKRPFFRADYSVDLLKARQKIVSDLRGSLGDFRDFNGGMILKQDESLQTLRQLLGKLEHEQELLLENYFYSLKPAVMQTVHEPALLKEHFQLLSKIISPNFTLQPYQLVTSTHSKHFLGFIAAYSGGFKEKVLGAIHSMGLPPQSLTLSFLTVKNISALSFIVRSEQQDTLEELVRKISSALQEWSGSIFCVVF